MNNIEDFLENENTPNYDDDGIGREFQSESTSQEHFAAT